jgi:HSP20 family protein
MEGQVNSIQANPLDTLLSGDTLDVNNQLKFEEKEKSFHYEMTVPGFKKKQIQLVVLGNTLLVEAYKRERTVSQNGNGKEQNEFCFKTILDLPAEIESKKIKAFYKKNLLLLEVPKLKHSKLKPLRIAIQ